MHSMKLNDDPGLVSHVSRKVKYGKMSSCVAETALFNIKQPLDLKRISIEENATGLVSSVERFFGRMPKVPAGSKVQINFNVTVTVVNTDGS